MKTLFLFGLILMSVACSRESVNLKKVTPPQNDGKFITEWLISTQNETISIYTSTNPFIGSTNLTIDWGDGATENYQADPSNPIIISHTYTSEGLYLVKMSGVFPALSFSNQDSLSRVVQWGLNQWGDLSYMFEGCDRLDITATDVPNIAPGTSADRMFLDAINMNSNISNWNVSNITNMDSMFRGATSFNQDLSGWNVDHVTDCFNFSRNTSIFGTALSPKFINCDDGSN